MDDRGVSVKDLSRRTYRAASTIRAAGSGFAIRTRSSSGRRPAPWTSRKPHLIAIAGVDDDLPEVTPRNGDEPGRRL